MLLDIAPKAVRRSRLYLVLITVAGAALRLIALTGAPPALFFDEAVYGLMAQEIGPGNWPVFFSAYTGREPLYIYAVAGMFRLFGVSAWTMRFTSALIGTASIPLAYLLFRELYGERVGLLSAATMATCFWHVGLSRAVYSNVLMPPIQCLSTYFLVKGYRSGSRWQMALGGAFIGLSLYTYLSARFWPLTLALWGLYTLIVEPRRTLSRWQGWVLAVVACLIVFAPLGVHFLQHPEDFLERAGQIAVFARVPPAEAPAVVGRNLLQTLGGLIARGDPRVKFNLPGRPAFMIWLAPFFVWGVARALRHPRRVELPLLVLWVLGMCVPAILTVDDMPAWQRMVGTMPAIFALTALGLDEALQLAQMHLKPAVRWVAPALGVFLLVFDGAVTVHDYFGIWAKSSEVFNQEHGPYQLVAERAAKELDAGHMPVVITQQYKHATTVFLEPRTVDIVWTVGAKTLPLPVRGKEVVYLWPQYDSPLREELRQILYSTTKEQEPILDPQGNVSVRVFTLDPQVLAAEAQIPTVALFGQEMAVLDWELDSTAPRTKPARLLLHWRALAHPDSGRVLSVHIYDAQGLRWINETSLGYLPEQWQPGDTVYQLYELELPRGMPAGRYQVRLLMSHEGGEGALPVIVDGQLAGSYVDLGWFTLTAEGGTIEPPQAGLADLAPGLRLIAHEALPTTARQGDTLGVTVFWQALAEQREDLDVALALADAEGHEVFAEPFPLCPGYSTSQWQVNEVVQARYALSLREAPVGIYRLQLRVGSFSLSLGEVTIEGVERSFTVPEMDQQLGALFGGEIRLLGYSLPGEVYHAGDVLPLTLYWQAEAQPSRDDKVFVHLVDATGAIAAQRDAAPVDWTRPTSGWVVGEVVSDPQYLALPADLAAGEYTLYVGLYDAETMQRLATDAGEQGRVLLGTIHVQ